MAKWIQLDCPNGHPVKVDEKYAGRTGKCPACGSIVKIPAAVTDDDILDILGPPVQKEPDREPIFDSRPVHQEPVHNANAGGSSLLGGSAILQQAMKTCPKCKRRVSSRYQICPHCKTYMPMSVTDVRPQGSNNCQLCGTTSFPGATVCANCGQPLR